MVKIKTILIARQCKMLVKITNKTNTSKVIIILILSIH